MGSRVQSSSAAKGAKDTKEYAMIWQMLEIKIILRILCFLGPFLRSVGYPNRIFRKMTPVL